MNHIGKSVAAGAVALLFGAVAQAAPVSSVLFGGFQQLSDNSAESLIDQGGSAAGIVDVGDRLRGIFTIETVEKTGETTRNLGGVSGNHELSGIFDVTVASKVNLGAAGFFFTFAPTVGFGATIGQALPAGAMVAFFQDPAAEYSRVTGPGCTSSAIGGNCEANITDGSLYWVAGFSGAGGTAAGAGEGWSALAVTDNIGAIGSIPAPGNGGFFNLGLDLLANFSGKELGTVACSFGAGNIEFCGSGSLLGTGGVTTPYSSFDNVDFAINVVPEPSSIALVGLGLVGLAATARRRKV